MAPLNPSCPHATDPDLLRQNSDIRDYSTARHAYPGLRVFYRPHPQADQFSAVPSPLPLLVFIHGLGGSVAQFHPLLTTLAHIAPCLAVDLPGCGRSRFANTAWDAYSTDALVELLDQIISEHRDAARTQGVVLIGHSMGTALAAQLASGPALADHVVGLVAICPTLGPPPDKVPLFRRLLWVPGWIFDLWRAWDRRGGPESPSVLRFVGQDAPPELRALQNRYNDQSRTPVWRRMAWGFLPDEIVEPSRWERIWAALKIPVFLVGGAADTVTSPKEVDRIAALLLDGGTPQATPASTSQTIPDSAAPIDTSTRAPAQRLESIGDISAAHFLRRKLPLNPDDPHAEPLTPQEPPAAMPAQPRHPAKTVQTKLLPAPANHTLLYAPATVRIVAGLISDFAATHISPRLALAWQLQHLSREGKWDVKNLAKWQAVAPVSGPIGTAGTGSSSSSSNDAADASTPPIFRALKTLREADAHHCPAVFAQQWRGAVADVVDISHDQPVYDPRGLERAGIRYHKFPTVSKVPPSGAEVDAFVALVDGIRAAHDGGGAATVGVHCHYGFNRTGYFIVCYLVERCGMSLQDAIDEFARARPNGIRHSHFLDRLFMRYGFS